MIARRTRVVTFCVRSAQRMGATISAKPKSEENRGQVDVPVVQNGKIHRFEPSRHDDEDRREHGVERKDPEVEPQEFRVEGDVLPTARALFFGDRGCGRIGNDKEDHGEGRQGEKARDDEESRNAEELVQRRRDDEREREGETDRSAHHRHGLRDDALAHAVGNHRRDGGRNGARPLQGAAEHDETDLIGDGREKTPHGEDEKPDDDHGLAAPTVAGDTEGNLQKALRQTVNAEREPHEKLVVASGDLVSVNREDG